MNRTKRNLLTSALSLLLCCAMLMGTTFAWFTDSVTSSNNIIKSGTLDVTMEWLDGTVDPTNEDGWKDASDGAIFNYDKWEPGYTQVRHVKIANEGTLALKYQLQIVAKGEVSELANVIDVYYADPAVAITGRDQLTDENKLGTLTEVLTKFNENASGNLSAGEEVVVSIALKMQEDAGNQYQNKSIGTDFSVQLVATQYTEEKDSFGPNYDVNAEYGDVVTNTNELKDAVAKGGNISIATDIEITETMTVANDVIINLEGGTIYHSKDKTSGRAFQMADGGSLTINAEGKTVGLSGHGLVEIPANVSDATVVVNGGTFTGDVHTGALVRLRKGNENINITLNNVNATMENGWIVSTAGVNVEDCLTLTVNGGSYVASAAGFEVYNSNVTINDADITTGNGFGILGSGNIEITNTNFTVTGDGNYNTNNPLDAGVAISGEGTLTMTGGKINMNSVEGNPYPWNLYCALVCNSGGHLVLNNVEMTTNNEQIKLYQNDATVQNTDYESSITIDGELK